MRKVIFYLFLVYMFSPYWKVSLTELQNLCQAIATYWNRILHRPYKIKRQASLSFFVECIVVLLLLSLPTFWSFELIYTFSRCLILILTTFFFALNFLHEWDSILLDCRTSFIIINLRVYLFKEWWFCTEQDYRDLGVYLH